MDAMRSESDADPRHTSSEDGNAQQDIGSAAPSELGSVHDGQSAATVGAVPHEIDIDSRQPEHDLPEDLPPVEPPSAKFIMQLFLVPGMIVAAVIGVWALFGQVSSSEQDWRQMVTEMRSNNEHRRWRGAQGLAQMLQVDHEIGDKGLKLSTNPQVAKELAGLLDELLKEKSADEELVKRQLFLTRTMGWLDVHDVVIPTLLNAMADNQNEFVRTDAIRVVALIAGRAQENGKPVRNQDLVDKLVELSSGSDPLTRQVCAYTMGLVPGNEIDQKLRVLSEDGDWETQVNAAFALSRRHMIDGFPVLIRILKSHGVSVDPTTMKGKTQQERTQKARSQESMNLVAIGNVMQALHDIDKVMNDSQRSEAIALVKKIQTESKVPRLRVKATETLRLLEGRDEKS